ncbi:hypothetical protein F5Y12DRAFT_797175 [Xylaria sp. FL1777]|nr:hypothetical protein F5Y12DRAFT_797175 [Xylaria sp. FL1777]
MSSQIHLLKSNATVRAPTAEEPWYVVEVTSPNGHCQISIAATKPLPDPILKVHPDWEKLEPKPESYVSLTHAHRCRCMTLSKAHDTLFETWQHIHTLLRYNPRDNASYAFYPEFEYEVGEALAHASLVASFAMRKPLPDCYDHYKAYQLYKDCEQQVAYEQHEDYEQHENYEEPEDHEEAEDEEEPEDDEGYDEI